MRALFKGRALLEFEVYKTNTDILKSKLTMQFQLSMLP